MVLFECVKIHLFLLVLIFEFKIRNIPLNICDLDRKSVLPGPQRIFLSRSQMNGESRVRGKLSRPLLLLKPIK